MEGLCYWLNTTWNVGVLEIKEIGSCQLIGKPSKTKTVHLRALLLENLNPEVAAFHIKHGCTKSNHVFLPSSSSSKGRVLLMKDLVQYLIKLDGTAICDFLLMLLYLIVMELHCMQQQKKEK